MIIGKLIKPCKICIYEIEEDGGEIESFSLLKLSLQEAVELLLNIDLKADRIETTLDGSVVLKYSGNDELHNKWKELAVNHKNTNPQEFVDVSKTFTSTINGTSVLIRDPKKHVIRICKRNGDDTLTINRIPIDDIQRESFFTDVKTGVYFKNNKKYAMSPDDQRDFSTYIRWSNFMNVTYEKVLKKEG